MQKRLKIASDDKINTIIKELETAKECLENVDKIWADSENTDEVLEDKIAGSYPIDEINFNNLIYKLENWINNLKR